MVVGWSGEDGYGGEDGEEEGERGGEMHSGWCLVFLVFGFWQLFFVRVCVIMM